MSPGASHRVHTPSVSLIAGASAPAPQSLVKRSQWIKRWGVDVAKKMHAEVSEAFDLFRDLIGSGEFDCDPQEGGHYYLAHKPGVMANLEKESKLLNEVFGYGSRIISREELHENHVKDQEAAGAMHEPDHPSAALFRRRVLDSTTRASKEGKLRPILASSKALALRSAVRIWNHFPGLRAAPTKHTAKTLIKKLAEQIPF